MEEEEEVNPGATSSVPALSLGAPSADQENIDTIIREVARDAEAEANKIAAEEAAKDAAEDVAKEPPGETGKAAAEETDKGPAREAGKAAAEEGAVEDQPSSSAASGSGRYLKVSDDLFVHLPGTESTGVPTKGEVFDDEAKSRMAVVDKAEADLEERVAEVRAWFRQAHKDLKAAQDMLAECKLEIVMKQADIEKAQEVVKQQAAQDEAARDTETLAQRVAKRAKASTGDKPPAGASSTDQENIDTINEEVARDAEAEANKIAAEEATKTADEDAAKGPAGEAGKATVKVEQLLRGMSANFQKLQALHRARLDKAKSRMAAVDKAEVDLAWRVAET
nr:tol-Pal system protein TolA-like [Aegilops tauschii subsp. strangulata]